MELLVKPEMLTSSASALPNVGPYIYDISISGFTRSSIYIYDISSLRVNDLSCSPNIVRMIKSRRMRWAGHVARMEEGRGLYGVLMGKPKGRRTLGRSSRRCEHNIKMNLQEVGCGVWTGSSWLRIGTGGGHL